MLHKVARWQQEMSTSALEVLEKVDVRRRRVGDLFDGHIVHAANDTVALTVTIVVVLDGKMSTTVMNQSADGRSCARRFIGLTDEIDLCQLSQCCRRCVALRQERSRGAAFVVVVAIVAAEVNQWGWNHVHALVRWISIGRDGRRERKGKAISFVHFDR